MKDPKQIAQSYLDKVIRIGQTFAENCVREELLVGFTAFRAVVIDDDRVLVEPFSSDQSRSPQPVELSRWAQSTNGFPVAAIAIVSMAVTVRRETGEQNQGLVISGRTAFGDTRQYVRNWVADGPVGDWEIEPGHTNFSDLCRFAMDAAMVSQLHRSTNLSPDSMGVQRFGTGE